jgi:DNA replication initiation complex subunit (GINS family)
MKTPIKTLLKPLSLALFVAATLPAQSAHIRTSPPSDTIPAIGPSSHFCKAIGGKNDDEGKSLIQTSDGGYAITGYTSSFGAGKDDVYVVKLDARGNLQWTKTIGEKERDRGNSLIQTSDGGYAIAGLTQSFGAGETDVYVVKLDAHGNLQWTKTIGGLGYDGGTSLVQTSDGGYAITGATTSFGVGEADVYVVKLDANGNLQWTKTIGGPELDAGFSLIQTSDSGYAIAGHTKSFGAGEGDVYVVKLDANGNLQWTKTIGGPGEEVGSSLIQTSDGGYAITGFTQSFGAGGADVYVLKLDANGNLQWTKTIGGLGNEIGHSLIQTSDGGYAITGATTSFGVGEADVYVVKLDANGNLQWTKTIGAKNENPIRSSIIQTSDGSYVIAGTTRSFGAGGMDVYVVKLDKNGDACCAVSQTPQVGSGGTLGSPTPSIRSGGTLTSPTSSTSSGGTLSNQCR